MSGARDATDRGRCFCGEPLIMSSGGAACAGCSLAPMDCLNEGECLQPDDGDTEERKPMVFTRPADTERQHFEGPDDERLIAHQATPGIVEVLREQFGLEPISRGDYTERERLSMRTDPPEGKG